jgi:hypothetical protein
VLEQVLQAAGRIDSEFTKARWLLIALVGAEVSLGNFGEARSLTEASLRAADTLDSDFARVRVLESVAAAAAKLGEAEPVQARVLLGRVLEATNKIADSSLRSRVLISVAQAAGKLRDPAEGRTVLHNVLAATESGYGQAERAGCFSGPRRDCREAG